ncbi:hypothetical protein [Sunxiuqinia indica]|uniref:hypothetical protein n=1 Tax=Sunxiuqinia indica TaxID=2692584 RepID=UPI00135A9C63|nr:hypothetical protein [Sunxiuqinia indica]
MNDKERILTTIAAMTAYSTTEHRVFDENTIRWEHIHEDTELKKGDIVCGMTNPNHEFGVSFFIERTGYSDFLVQEIGSNKTCNYTNEMFLVLRNFPDMYKLCGNEHKIMLKIRKALYDIYMWKFVKVDFEPKKLKITLREKWTNNMFSFDFDYDCPLSRVTLKSLKIAIENETKSK